MAGDADNSVSPRSPSPLTPSGQETKTYEELQNSLGKDTAEKELREKAERFLQELPNIAKCMDSPATWANEHETVFQKFRRGCLDANTSPFLEANFYGVRDIETVWLFLIENARQHPRAMRKNLGECGKVLGASYNWSIVLRGSPKVTAALQGLPPEIYQNFLEDAGCEGGSGDLAAALAPAAKKVAEERKTPPRSRPAPKEDRAVAGANAADASSRQRPGRDKETIETQLRRREELAALRKENRELRQAQRKQDRQPCPPGEPSLPLQPRGGADAPWAQDGTTAAWPPQSGGVSHWPEPSSMDRNPRDANANPSQSYNPFRNPRHTDPPQLTRSPSAPAQHPRHQSEPRQSQNLFAAALDAFSPVARPASPLREKMNDPGHNGPQGDPLFALAAGAFSPVDKWAAEARSMPPPAWTNSFPKQFGGVHRPATLG